MKQWIIKLLSDKGEISSKRFVTIISSIALVSVLFCNVLLKKSVDVNILNAITWVIGVGLGTTVAEKFAAKPTPPPLDEKPTEENEVQN